MPDLYDYEKNEAPRYNHFKQVNGQQGNDHAPQIDTLNFPKALQHLAVALVSGIAGYYWQPAKDFIFGTQPTEVDTVSFYAVPETQLIQGIGFLKLTKSPKTRETLGSVWNYQLKLLDRSGKVSDNFISVHCYTHRFGIQPPDNSAFKQPATVIGRKGGENDIYVNLDARWNAEEGIFFPK